MGKEYTRRQSILGNVPIYGEVVLYEDFEDNLSWVEGGTGGNTVFRRQLAVSFNKSSALHIKSRTTSAAEDDTIYATKAIYLLPSKKLNFSFLIRLPDLSATKYLSIEFFFFDGTTFHQAEIRYDITNTIFQYLNSSNAFINITGSTITTHISHWHLISLSIDFSNDLYLSFSIDHFTFFFSDISIRTTVDATSTALIPLIQIQTAGAAIAEAYIDSILIHEL